MVDATARPSGAGIPLLDPNLTPFPRSSLYDFSGLVEDDPAGTHGFLQVQGDHFVWGDGRRARFWGISVASTSLQSPNDGEIRAVIHNFKAAGFNLIRLHDFDDSQNAGIIDSNAQDSQHLIAARLRKLDYWIYCAKQAGIYIYLDLLDYRRFKAGDGVADAEAIGRSARPYSVFDPRLIELQQDYARKLLRDHINEYTGLAYADDPAIAMIELYDESGLFMRRNTWRNMPTAYATRFARMWNEWLKRQYGSTQKLAYAWTDGSGDCALTGDESLEQGTVQVPFLTWNPAAIPAAERKFAAAPRINDGARFAYELQRAYFHRMRAFAHGLGVRVPITATGRVEDLADLKAVRDELDFVGSNFYYDHPSWTGLPAPWTVPALYNNVSPLTVDDGHSMAASMSLGRVRGKPFVLREWNYCWPNQNRASGMIEAACFACVHDIDAMILFDYQIEPTARLSYFNVRCDPARWGLCGVAADIFLRQLILPSKYKIVVPYGPVDTFTYTGYHQPFYELGWAERVENDFFDGDTYAPPHGSGVDLILSPGRSGVGHYYGAPAVLYTNDLRSDLAGHTVATPEYLVDYGLATVNYGRVTLDYDGLLYDANQNKDRELERGLPLDALLGQGLRPIGSNQAVQAAHGFEDATHQAFVFGSLAQSPDDSDKGPRQDDEVTRAALDAMQEFHGVANSHDADARQVFRTDDREILRDTADGRLIVGAAQVQALCGNMRQSLGLSWGLNVRNMTGGSLVALALDGMPLGTSRRFMVKFVTDARNTNQMTHDRNVGQDDPMKWQVDVLGSSPVDTQGKASSIPLQIFFGGRELLEVFLTHGGFELLVQDREVLFYCDTPGTRFALFPSATGQAPSGLEQVSVVGVTASLPTDRIGDGLSAVFPAHTAVVRWVSLAH